MAKVIQIRDVPDEVHDRLVRKAAARGLSLAAYLREVLEREADQPSLPEWLEQVRGTLPAMTGDEIVEMIHAGRAER